VYPKVNGVRSQGGRETVGDQDVAYAGSRLAPPMRAPPRGSRAGSACGGATTPGDGGGRWRHPLAFTMRMLRLAGVWRPRDVVWRKGERPRDIKYQIYTVFTVTLYLIFTVSGMINIKYSTDNLSHLTDVVSMVAVSVFNGAKESRSKSIQNLDQRLTTVTKVMGTWVASISTLWISAPLLAKLLSPGHLPELEAEFNATTTASFTAEPATEPPPPRLPFDLWFPLDLRDNLNYALGVLTQSVAVIVDDAYSVLSNIFWIGMLYGGCVCLRLLRASLRELSPESQPSPDVYLAKCIRQHQAILSFVREVSELLGPIILVESLNMMVLMTCVVFHASSLGIGNAKVLSSISFLCYEMSELLLFSYFATELMWECEQVANDVYYSQWFRCSVSTRKSVYFVMLRAFTPSVVNVSGFTVLGLDLFSALVRASYSMLAVLQQANDN
ncbi:Odorant receptor 49b, partial [Gryllus bimaculatus]